MTPCSEESLATALGTDRCTGLRDRDPRLLLVAELKKEHMLCPQSQQIQHPQAPLLLPVRGTHLSVLPHLNPFCNP